MKCFIELLVKDNKIVVDMRYDEEFVIETKYFMEKRNIWSLSTIPIDPLVFLLI